MSNNYKIINKKQLILDTFVIQIYKDVPIGPLYCVSIDVYLFVLYALCMCYVRVTCERPAYRVLNSDQFCTVCV